MQDDLTKILSAPAYEVAPLLVGSLLVRELDGQKLVGRIVETEAYDQSDVASHSYRGETPRTKVMFGRPGHLYVYFTYGMHYCCNIVTGPAGHGSAVLIRALEPIEGLDEMQANRNGRQDLCNGPAKLCQALKIDKNFNGQDLRKPPIQLVLKPALPQSKIIQATRIGISEGKDMPWRFFEAGNEFVSRKA